MGVGETDKDGVLSLRSSVGMVLAKGKYRVTFSCYVLKGVALYRCPSSTAPAGCVYGSVEQPPWFVLDRAPCNYLGVVTGLQPNDWRPEHGWGSRPKMSIQPNGTPTLGVEQLDGMMITRPRGTQNASGRWANRIKNVGFGGVKFADVTDGLSNTLMIGEA
jgi:hypothetical protein